MALYDPSLEKDNCGFGLIAHTEGGKNQALLLTKAQACSYSNFVT